MKTKLIFPYLILCVGLTMSSCKKEKKKDSEEAATEIPSAPCSIPDNSTTGTSIIGVGGVNYTFVKGYDNFPPAYSVQATKGTAQTLIFTFKNGGVEPKPGVYKSTSDSNLGNNEKDITVTVHYSWYAFDMKAGFNVYVTKVNGKLHLAFCDAEFFNPVNNNPIVMSGSVTLP